MFTNVGGKIKTLASVIAWAGIIGCVITGLVMVCRRMVMPGLALAVGGALGSWIVAFNLYGYGELIESNSLIASCMQVTKSPMYSQEELNKERLASGGWKCTCGRIHFGYVSTCACGKNRREMEG